MIKIEFKEPLFALHFILLLEILDKPHCASDGPKQMNKFTEDNTN